MQKKVNFPRCSDIHQQMRRQMRDMDRMMESMMDPFGMLSRHSMYAGPQFTIFHFALPRCYYA